MREILFVAGETSGDLHAAGVARELVAARVPYLLTGVGGDAMAAAGVNIFQRIEKLSVMGFIEPLKRLPLFRRLRAALRARIESGSVALVVLVDYGGFNLKIAEIAAGADVPVLYYISPQVWASRASRLNVMARTITKAAVILPFEESLLRERGIDVSFVGHPLLDMAAALPNREEARRSLGIGADVPLLVLFPGSRRQEIAQHLDTFVAAAQELQSRNPALEVVVGAAPSVDIPSERCPFPLVHSASFTLLRAADAAMCKSGTTTLEAAVALCPLIVAYKTDRLTYAVAKRLATVRYFGLVNVLAGHEVAPEFLQGEVRSIPIANALEPLLDHTSQQRKSMVSDLQKIRDSLGEAGAAERVAALAMDMLGLSNRGIA